MAINEVFVIGAGFMGAGIAQLASIAGYRVTLADLDDDRLEAATETIRQSVARMVKAGRIEQPEADKALSEIRTTVHLEDARSADLVVEAVPERAELKKAIFEQLDGLCRPQAILATNTSAIPVTMIAAATRRPANVVATHFFGPVPVMRLCEIAGGLLTSDSTIEAADEWARSLGKETVIVSGDIAGFIANRVTIPSSLEAVRMVDDGIATATEIDQALAAFGIKTGPMRIMDNAGIDVSFSAAMAIFEDTGDDLFLPPPLMRRMVAAGLLGRKSGRGFYDYSIGEPMARDIVPRRRPAVPGENRAPAIFNRFYIPTIFEAVRLVESKRATVDEVDKAVRLGFNFPLGPLQTADFMGLDNIVNASRSLQRETGATRFRPPSLLKSMATAGRLGRACGKGFYEY